MKKILNFLRSCFFQDKSILPTPAETNLPSPRYLKYRRMEKKMDYSIYYKRTQKK